MKPFPEIYDTDFFMGRGYCQSFSANNSGKHAATQNVFSTQNSKLKT
jgi:hypothetical protein